MRPAVALSDVSKSFRLPPSKSHTLKERVLHPFRARRFDVLQAVDDVSVEIAEGEFFGIVGRNGSGKSTLLKCLAGIYSTDSGTLEVNGRLSPFIELGVGFNPELTARDNAIINAIMLGLSRKAGAGAVRGHRGVRRARGVHGPQAQELLVGHDGSPGILGRDPGRCRHRADRRGAGRRRRIVPAEML